MNVRIRVAEPTGTTVVVFDADGVISTTEYGSIRPAEVKAALLAGGFTAEEITVDED